MKRHYIDLDQRIIIIRRLSYELETLDVRTMNDMAYKNLYYGMLNLKEVVDMDESDSSPSVSECTKQRDRIRRKKRVKEAVKGIPGVGPFARKIYRKIKYKID